tara:strand:- start:115 stop:327 length:213 start_codon:yes stop_codon:yes gene_type:complete
MKTPQLDFLIADVQANINQEDEATQEDIDLLWEMLTIKLTLRDKLDLLNKCNNPSCVNGVVARVNERSIC